MKTQRFVVTLLLIVGVATASVAGPLGPHAVAAPAPVTFCNFVAAGDVKLTVDLTCTGTSGIIVAGNGITIDLGGHTLTGNLTAGTHGIRNTGGYDNVRVVNGTVKRFQDGVHAAADADGMDVRHVVSLGNTDSGVNITGDSAHVRSSDASSNSLYGISIAGASARVTSSVVSRNADSGIVIGGRSARVTSSYVSGNGWAGMSIIGASAYVRSSKASGNAANGIEVIGDAPRIGQTTGRPTSDRNYADANGFGSVNTSMGPGLGIYTFGFAKQPRGRNEARGNANSAECDPSNLC